MQAYIANPRRGQHEREFDVRATAVQLYSTSSGQVRMIRVNKTRWCVLRWPTPSMAQAAGMSTEAFENLYFDVCTMDYAKMGRAMVRWKNSWRQTDHVRLVAPGTA